MREQILAYLRRNAKPVSEKDIAQALKASPAKVREALEALVSEALIVATRKWRYALPEKMELVAVRVSFQRNGTPVAKMESTGDSWPMDVPGPDRPMPDDLVFAHIDGLRCSMYSIIRRGRTALTATLRLDILASRETYTAVPCDMRLPYGIKLTGDLSEAQNNALALLKIEKYPEANRPIVASIVRVLGDSDSMRAVMRSVAEEYGFSTVSAPEVEEEAVEYPDVIDAGALLGREDLRELLTFTIDGITARDFDDAISLERTDAGWRLGVHIADVSHYVKPDSAIDADALARGTSLYLPGLTVPMLPECLSNHLCSLMPDVDRLTMSLFMDIVDGTIVDHRLCRAVIRSHARLTYQAVNRLFDGGECDFPDDIREALLNMRALSHQMREGRRAKGAIDFEMEEPEFIMDEHGEPEEILPAPRGDAEKLIEEFMLAANTTTAAMARYAEWPFIYRVHDEPDTAKLQSLERFLSLMNLHERIAANPHPGRLQALLDKTADHPARDIVRQRVLRALKRARYSEKPLGHFALAMADYCQFTSPIRRYPDLVVHRMLKLLLDGDTEGASRVAWRMPAIAQITSQRENAATQAERQGDSIMMAAWMSKHIGEVFEGVISNVVPWGFYVALPNQVEGLVRVADLDGFYEYDPECCRFIGEIGGIEYRLGDCVRVRAQSAVIPAGEIGFSLETIQE